MKKEKLRVNVHGPFVENIHDFTEALAQVTESIKNSGRKIPEKCFEIEDHKFTRSSKTGDVVGFVIVAVNEKPPQFFIPFFVKFPALAQVEIVRK